MVMSVEPVLHRRIGDELRRRIFDGELAVGDAVPSESQLAEDFGASRGTVRQALAGLRIEGLIGGGRGRPPVVRSTVAAQPFDTFLSFTAWARGLGRTPGQRTVEVARRAVGEEAADVLDLAPGDPVVEVLRLRLLDGQPAMLERATFVEPVGRLLFEFDPDAGSIYAYLTSRGVDLAAARHTFDAVASGPVDAEHLGVTVGAPLLRERRRTTTAGGEPLEYGDDRYLPGVVTFTIDNTRTPGPAVVAGWRLPVEAAPVGVAVARAARCEAARAGDTDHGGRDDVTYPRTF
jgi:GntR family transcriptional regulator